MTTCKPFADDATQVPVRLKDVWRADRWVLLLSTGVCIFLAIKLNLVAGDPVSVLWKYPLSYRDDGLACLQTMRKLMDGWLLYASRAGYPMGASFHDYPMSDLGSLVILKLLGMLTGSPVASVNTFYILGYPAASVCAHLVLRLLGMRTWPAVVCSLLFALLPFHFLRIEHLFLTWYFQVPIYVYAAYRVWRSGQEDSPWSMSRSALSLWLLLLATLSGFGLYYAFFGAMLICIGALLGWLRGCQWRPVWLGGLFVVAISAGLAANVLPNQILNPYGSPNPEAVQRAAFETEYNGLKLTQLFVPHIHHRSAYLKTVAETYARDFPLSTENHTASLGMVGAAGVLLLLYHMARAFARPDPGDVQRFLAAGFLALFLFATIGGLSTPFSSIVSPVIRCTNRVSVFLGFLALASVFFTWQRAFPGAGSAIPRTYRWAGAALLVVLFLLGAGINRPNCCARPCMSSTRASSRTNGSSRPSKPVCHPRLRYSNCPTCLTLRARNGTISKPMRCPSGIHIPPP